MAFKYDHAHLTTPDPARAVDFYTRVLGARLVKQKDDGGKQMIELDLGGAQVRISNYTGADDKWAGPRHGLHHLGLVVEDLDKVAADMRAAGVEFVAGPVQSKSGTKYAFIKGPDGVLLEVTEKK